MMSRIRKTDVLTLLYIFLKALDPSPFYFMHTHVLILLRHSRRLLHAGTWIWVCWRTH